MLLALLLLWSAALFLMLADPRSPVLRWLAAVSFCGGAGALAAVIDTMHMPEQGTALYRLMAASSLTSYYGVPFSFLLFALHYHPATARYASRTLTKALLLVPIAAMFFLLPPYNTMHPISFPIVAAWAVPSILVGAAIMTARKELLPMAERTHLFACIAVLTPVLGAMTMNYVLPSFGHLRMWVYNPWMIAFGFTVFLFALFTYGFLGTRLLVERRKLDTTLRAITSGTAILNHAIKNDVGKMRLFGEKIKGYAERTEQEELRQDIESVLSAARHIQEMIVRVHARTQDLALQPSPCEASAIAREAVAELSPRMEGQQVRLQLRTPETPFPVLWDAAQVKEALTNVIVNALEAMPQGGELSVSVYETKREIIMETKDTGPGMESRKLSQAMEPFYTTKAGSGLNFGLGLSYAYAVMRKHRGSLQIRSAPGQGTSVFLAFPKRSPRRPNSI